MPYHAGILLRRHLKPLAAQVGVPRLGWHTFRHTFRSWLDAVGTAVGVQQKMMRHADVATTVTIYGKGMMDSKLEAHTKLLQMGIYVTQVTPTACGFRPLGLERI
jgi:integrase